MELNKNEQATLRHIGAYKLCPLEINLRNKLTLPETELALKGLVQKGLVKHGADNVYSLATANNVGRPKRERV